MGRNAMFVALLLGIMILQVTVVNRLPLPGHAAPDLVLLAVVGYALARGAAAGAVMGFAAGLVSDLLPPAAHLLGHNALVFCLIGFMAGRAVESRPAAGPLAALACAIAGPVVALVTGALVGDPRAGVSMLTAVLPQAMIYNLLAAPPVVWMVRRVVRGPEPRLIQMPRSAMRSRA
ncbi:rod shape-determining protein MreD [Streptosporangium sp. NPDC000095]|uniref:rod shape-determining protein MreD n=1 Tax=Streptosporangium sp. NPDC000095 TaxID=3366184 RepID=UPI0036B5235C